jgi:3-hydroxyisobutyrate dehydrogenase
MGTAIGGRLLRLGHKLTVWNRTPGRTQALADAGAQVAATASAVADASEVIMTLVTDAAALEAVYSGPGGLLSGDVAGKLFMEMSTVRPETSRQLAAKAREKGAAMIDCPVGGTVGPASSGQLLAVIGGEAADIARVRPLLETLCRRIEHVGPVGSGCSVKLAMNLTTQVYWQAFGEALSLCRPLGLAPERLMDIFAASSGAPRVLEHRAKDFAAAMNGREIEPVNFDVDSVRKDMRAMVEEAAALGWRLPVAERALECFDAQSKAGNGARDCGMVPVLFSREPGS